MNSHALMTAVCFQLPSHFLVPTLQGVHVSVFRKVCMCMHAHRSLETLGLSRNSVPFSAASLCLCYYRLFSVQQPRTFTADIAGSGPQFLAWGEGLRGGKGSVGFLFLLTAGDLGLWSSYGGFSTSFNFSSLKGQINTYPPLS